MVNLAIEISSAILDAIAAGIAGLWIYFLFNIVKSMKNSPQLQQIDAIISDFPTVSIILPARNEEAYIGPCLESLMAQSYPDFEIIAINDSSSDGTEERIQHYAMKDPRIVYVKGSDKPEGWVGKNWACIEGYRRSKGSILLFTDADTIHSPDSIILAVSQIVRFELAAVSAVPRLICNDFWTKAALPCLSVFLHTRFSALRVNDPKTKTGYFFGSFYAIRRDTYEAVGTHESVRTELVEDGALGAKVKESGFRLRMVRGERQVKAIWARDPATLWQGLRRLMIPVYYQNKRNAFLMTLAVFMILLEPFLAVPFSFFAWQDQDLASALLLIINAIALGLLLATIAVQCWMGVHVNPAYSLVSMLGGLLITLAFVSSLVDARKKDSVVWRERKYTVTSQQHPLR